MAQIDTTARNSQLFAGYANMEGFTETVNYTYVCTVATYVYCSFDVTCKYR